MTSGLRLDEILADYFTQRDEKAREKFKDSENVSVSSKSSHHKRKHKKKSKKHKRSRDCDNDEQASHQRRSRSGERSRKDESHHKKRHKDKKHNKHKGKEQSSETPVLEDKRQVGSLCSDSVPVKEGTDVSIVSYAHDGRKESAIPFPAVTLTKLEMKDSATLNSGENQVTLNNAEQLKDVHVQDAKGVEKKSRDAESVNEASSSLQNNSDSLEEGEVVDNPTESAEGDKTDSALTSHKHKGKKKKKRKRGNRSRSSSAEQKHSRLSELQKHHHYHHIHHRHRSRNRRDSRSPHDGSSSKRSIRSRSRSLDSETQPEGDPHEHIDKKRLLEIARKNVLEMIENGTLPQGLPVSNLQPQQLASIKAGGKSVQELTEFCKALAQKPKDYSSSGSDDEQHHAHPASDEEDTPFLHHPFKVKEVQPVIRMNIRNAVQLPVRTTAEKTADAVKLRQQFPVSSGSQHRTKELEWVPVEKAEVKPVPAAKKAWGGSSASSASLAAAPAPAAASKVAPPVSPPVVNTPPVNVVLPLVTAGTPGPVDDATSTSAPPTDSVFPAVTPPAIDIGSIMAERLHAIRMLQENPHDPRAITKMYNAQQQMQNWAQSKIQPGQFGHSVTNRLLTPEELTGPYPVWARKDQLTCATPVQGGIGMHLLKKMGWNPGEGLGKNKEGSLVPLMLDVKTDKKGLYSNTEAPKPARSLPARVAHDLSGKHPVSALMELCSKRKWGAPDYQMLDETGPDHRKSFLFKVHVQGVDYQPSVSSATKKQAKALAATVCLQAIGLLPRDLNNPL